MITNYSHKKFYSAGTPNLETTSTGIVVSHLSPPNIFTAIKAVSLHRTQLFLKKSSGLKMFPRENILGAALTKLF
jgi:hypothetical protein